LFLSVIAAKITLSQPSPLKGEDIFESPSLEGRGLRGGCYFYAPLRPTLISGELKRIWIPRP